MSPQSDYTPRSVWIGPAPYVAGVIPCRNATGITQDDVFAYFAAHPGRTAEDAALNLQRSTGRIRVRISELLKAEPPRLKNVCTEVRTFPNHAGKFEAVQ